MDDHALIAAPSLKVDVSQRLNVQTCPGFGLRSHQFKCELRDGGFFKLHPERRACLASGVTR